jgi:hypothetical protein
MQKNKSDPHNAALDVDFYKTILIVITAKIHLPLTNWALQHHSYYQSPQCNFTGRIGWPMTESPSKSRSARKIILRAEKQSEWANWIAEEEKR